MMMIPIKYGYFGGLSVLISLEFLREYSWHRASPIGIFTVLRFL